MPATVRYDEQYCPIARALDVLGDRWTLLILRELVNGDQRFTDLRASLPGIAPTVLTQRLRTVHGVGPWTAAETVSVALGDADAVSVGDFHIPNLVAWALAGEPRGTDERMLELLEPYRGQRGRVIRLLEASGISAPRFGPRLAGRRIEAI